QSRALATYVRESEDIEHRVSGLYAKISNPVLANLKFTVSPSIKLAEVYPPQLPDLFHGSQLVVLGRYTGQGHAAIKLTGNVGKADVRFHVAPQMPAPPPALNAPGRPGEAPGQPKTVTSFVKEAQEKAKSIPGYGFGGGTGGPGVVPTNGPASGYGMMGGGMG